MHVYRCTCINFLGNIMHENSAPPIARTPISLRLPIKSQLAVRYLVRAVRRTICFVHQKSRALSAFVIDMPCHRDCYLGLLQIPNKISFAKVVNIDWCKVVNWEKNALQKLNVFYVLFFSSLTQICKLNSITPALKCNNKKYSILVLPKSCYSQDLKNL